MPDIKNSMNERYGSRSGHFNLRPWRERNINRWSDTVLSCYGIANDPSANGIMLTQHNIHQGLKLFGKAGEDSFTTELKQLHF